MRLCSTLTWILVLPCLIRVAVQLPIYLGGRAADDADPYVTALGLAKVAMGWPLQLAALAAMAWMLTRDRTPGRSPEPTPDRPPRARDPPEAQRLVSWSGLSRCSISDSDSGEATNSSSSPSSMGCSELGV